MKSLPDHLIGSTAHEVIEVTSRGPGNYFCTRCRKHGSLAELFSDEPQHLCTPHYESSTSGWLHDERFARFYFTSQDDQKSQT